MDLPLFHKMIIQNNIFHHHHKKIYDYVANLFFAIKKNINFAKNQ